MPTDPKRIIADLVERPEATLRTCRIFISGPLRGGIVDFVAESDANSRDRSVPFVKIVPASGAPGFAAYCVPVERWQGAPIWTDIPAPQASGPSLVLTTKLSGCCFVIQGGRNGALRCAHAWPNPGQDGAMVRDAIGKIGNYARVFGAGQEYKVENQRPTIVGVAVEGEWKFYVQINSTVDRIVSVDQLL